MTVPIDTPRPSDADVIAASLQHPASFGDLFTRHHAAVHRYLRRRFPAAVAEDLAAETFAVAFDGRARFSPAGGNSARPWLFGIATRLASRHRRSEVRGLRAYARTGVDPVRADHADRANAQLDAAARQPALADGLAGLSPRLREPLLLLAFADLSYEEIAAALGIPIGTVRSRIARARAQLSTALNLDPEDSR